LRAYLLNQENLEFIWSWEPDPSPPLEAAAEGECPPQEIPPSQDEAVVENLSAPAIDSEDADISATLTALASAVQHQPHPVDSEPAANRRADSSTVEATLVAIGGTVRQQAEEIQKIEARAELANQKAESAAARFGALESLAAHLRQMMEKLDEASVWANSARDQMETLNTRIEDLERRLAAQDVSFQTALQEQGKVAGALDARQAQSEQISKSSADLIATLASRCDSFDRRFEVTSTALLSTLQQQSARLQDIEEQLNQSRQAAEPASQLAPAEPEAPIAEAPPIGDSMPLVEPFAKGTGELQDVREQWAAGGKRKSRKRLIWTMVAAALLLAGAGIYSSKGVVEVYLSPKPLPPVPVKTAVPAPPLPDSSLETPVSAAPDESLGNAPQKVSVVLTAEEDAWVEAEADGKKVFAKLVQANQTRSFDATHRVMIRTGNLAGVTVSHNGKPIGKLGNVHAAGRVLFTSAGRQPM
jgi:uncharacterized protein DUF4115